MPPIPWNQAARAKSKAPGTAIGGGGISHALSRTVAPGSNAGSAAASAILMRSRGGSSVGGSGAATNRTASRAGSLCTVSILAANSAICARSRRGAATRSDFDQMRPQPKAATRLKIAMARPQRLPHPVAAAATASAAASRRKTVQAL